MPDIVGTWKLEKVKTVFYIPQEYDYSKNNIIYQFNANRALKILSDIEYYGKQAGEYTYRTENRTVIIGKDSPYGYQISGDELMIDDSPLDDPNYYFIRVK